MTTKPVCHDGRWFYFLHEIIRDDKICSSALIKAGVVSPSGLVHAPEVTAEAGRGDWGHVVPDWVSAWITAEGQRPWPNK